MITLLFCTLCSNRVPYWASVAQTRATATGPGAGHKIQAVKLLAGML
jgi:hypothetical protein